VKHPISDELEAYALNRLGPDNDRMIEEHLLVCEVCRNRLQHADWTIFAIRTAFPNDDFTHATQDGDIRVWIEPYIQGWAARLRGGKLDLLRVVRTPEKATLLTASLFSEAYPEHRCNPRCGSRLRIAETE
jgi:hypothetical protein